MRRTHLCHHFHCDPIFTCPQAVHIAESVELARQYMDIARTDPDFRCVLTEIDYLQGYWDIFVEERDEFLRLLREGHIETSGSYSEPNENSVGGEALVRNIVYGQWFLVNYLGGRGDVYMPFDVFGHVRQLPQILRRAGFIGAVWTKGSPRGGRRNQEATWWVAPDGSRILNRIASYGMVEWGGHDQLGGLVQLVERMRAHARPNDQPAADIVFRGSDFQSPPWWIVGRAPFLREHGIEVSQPSAYFADVLREAEDGLALPVAGREMSQYHVGTSLSRSELKIGARLAEQGAAEAEIWGTIATLFGEPYAEAAIDHAWRQILFCQHHDSITGTSNDQSYLDLMSHLHESLAESTAAGATSLDALAGHVRTDARSGRPIVVFNGLPFARSEPVLADLPRDGGVAGWEVVDETGVRHPAEVVDAPAAPTVVDAAKGTRLRFLAEDVPGIGHRTYWLEPSDSRAAATVIESDDRPVLIETPHVRMTLDPWRGGGITSLIEKTTGREIVSGASDHPLNDLVALKEGPGGEPSWELHTTGRMHFASTHRASVRAERTALGWTVTIRHPFPDADEVVRTLVLHDDLPRIDCTVTLVGYSGSRLLGRDRLNLPGGGTPEMHAADPEDRDLFGMLFPLGLSGVAPTWSDRFGQRVIRRSVGWLDFRTHQDRIESGCAMYSADQWIAASPSASLVLAGDGTSPHGVSPQRGIPLGMVRVIFPDRPRLRRAAERLVEALAVRGVTATPYLDAEDQASDPLQTDQVIAIGGPTLNAWCGAASAASGWPSDLPRMVRDVRLWENPPRAVPALVVNGADDEAVAAEVDRVIAELAGDAVAVPAEAVESAAVVPLDDVGLGVLNRGNIAASCEADGSLFLALQHSAGWCDWATPFYLGYPFVPERKTTIYRYALVPFAGSWRDARLPELAEAYNRPLIARAERSHPGDVPARHAWFTVEGKAVLLSALKPVGQPSVEFAERTVDAAAGAIVRVSNWDGAAGPIRLRCWTGIAAACTCDLAERPGAPLPVEGSIATVHLGANAIETVAVTPLRPTGFDGPGGNVPAPRRRIACRWWLHNAGAAPAGNMPAAVALRGDVLPGEPGVVRLSVANNRRDRVLAGEVRLSGPAGWAIEPRTVSVRIKPLAGFVGDVRVSAPEGRPGRLQAEMVVDGDAYADVLTIGEVAEPDVRVSMDRDAIVAEIANPSDDVLHLDLTLIRPLEGWPEATDFVRWPVPFRTASLALGPGATERVTIPVPPGMIAESWAFLKVAAAGHASYHRVPFPLERRVAAFPGAPTAIDFARADAALVVECDAPAELVVTAARDVRPPASCAPSPLATVRKYWTVGPVTGAQHVRSATLRLGIVPAEVASVADPAAVRIAQWQGDHWQTMATTFDRRTWTLAASIPADALRATTCWTVTGPSQELWRLKIGGRFFEASPYAGALDGDNAHGIVIGTAWNGICRIAPTGRVQWRRRFTGWIWPSPTFAVADVDGDGRQEIVAAPPDRTLALLDHRGHVIWRRDDLPLAIKPRPVVADIDGDGRNEIVVAVHGAGVWAYRADGTPLWQADLGPARISAPTVAMRADDGPTLLVNVGGRRLVTLGRRGALLRQIVFQEGDATARLVAEPVVTEALHPGRTEIIFAGHDGHLRLLADDGESVVWDLDLGAPIMARPAVLSGEGGESPVVVCGTLRGRLCGVTADGTVSWESDLDGSIQAPPVLADIDGDGRDEIIVGASRALRTHLFRRDGTRLGTLPYGAIWSHTVAVDDLRGDGTPVLITGTTDEHVVALALPAMPD